MSYILDALNKSEQERASKSTPSNTQSIPQGQSASRNKATWYPLILTLIAIALLIGYYLARLTNQTPLQRDAEIGAPVIASTQQHSEHSETKVNAVPDFPENKRQQSGTQLIQTLTPEKTAPTGNTPQNQNTESQTGQSIVAQQKTETPTNTPVTSQDLTDSNTQTTPEKSLTQENHPVPQEYLELFQQRADASRNVLTTPAASESAANQSQSTKEASNIPYITELSWTVRESIPDIEYTAHVYSGTGGTGFVIMNGAMRYQGYRVGENLYIRNIEEDSATLEYQGTLFKMKAMKSWRKH